VLRFQAHEHLSHPVLTADRLTSRVARVVLRVVHTDNLFGVLGAFFGLLSSHVFARDRQRLALLGHLLWEPLCRDIIAKGASPPPRLLHTSIS